MFEKLSTPALRAFTWATLYAQGCKHDNLNTRHLLLGLLKFDCSANKLLTSLQLAEKLAAMTEYSEGKGFEIAPFTLDDMDKIPFGTDIREVLQLSSEAAAITTLDLLFNIIQISSNSASSAILSRLEISPTELLHQISNQKDSLDANEECE